LAIVVVDEEQMSFLLRPWPLLAGLLLPISLSYYSVRQSQNRNAYIRDSLHAQSVTLSNIGKDVEIPPNEPVYTRTSLTETMKDIWNDDVEKTVDWVKSIEWQKLKSLTSYFSNKN